MTKEKGVTLISLAIYVTVILIVIGILATITNTFKNNIKEINSEGTNNYEIDKFNVYFLKEVKKNGNEVNSISETGNEILFTSGNKYTFKTDNSIYLNDSIKIAENIQSCVFSSSTENEKTVITVTIQAINADEKVLTYVMENGELVADLEDEEDYIYIDPTVLYQNQYEEIPYIEVTGSQYIDTGYIFRNKPKIAGKIMLTNSGDRDIMGMATAKEDCFIIDFAGNNLYYRYSSSSSTSANTGISVGQWYDFEFSDKVIVDNTEKLSIASYDFSTNDQSFLIGKGRTYGYCKFQEIKMYDGDTLVRDMKPCYRKSDNEVGMFDIVNNVFYSNNSGNGTFGHPLDENNLLPIEYQQVKFIESTAEQYIDTGYIFKNKPKVVGDIMLTYSDDRDIMGMATAKEGCFIIDFKANTLYYRYSSSSSTSANTGISIKTWYNFEFSDKVVIDNTEKLSIDSYNFSTNDQSFLLGKGRNYGWARFKEIKMYDGDILVRDMIPCYRKSDYKAGMYDIANNQFYTAIGSKDFIF